MSIKRLVSVKPDILEWFALQSSSLKILRMERYKLTKGFVSYFNDFRTFLRPSKSTSTIQVVETDTKKAESTDKLMAQFYEAEELTKRMKWKRVTWDDDVDYTSFSKRILDNDSMFKRVSAFSFMSIRVIRDPLTTDLVNLPQPAKLIKEGDLTSWFLREREPQVVKLYPTTFTTERRSAFQVEWSSGVVKILDTASAQEIFTFLITIAPRLQALQIKMDEQQLRQAKYIQDIKIRIGAEVKFNEFDTSFWDDPQRKTNENYINPDDLELFLQSLLKSAFLYRKFFQGQQIRVVSADKPYFIDFDKNELQIPVNFFEFNWLKTHSRFELLEKVFNWFRFTQWLWFSLGIIIVGDVEFF